MSDIYSFHSGHRGQGNGGIHYRGGGNARNGAAPNRSFADISSLDHVSLIDNEETATKTGSSSNGINDVYNRYSFSLFWHCVL